MVYAMTGISEEVQLPGKRLLIKGRVFERMHTFSDVTPGLGFCYLNSNGLIEIAVNQGNAAQLYNFEVGDTVSWVN